MDYLNFKKAKAVYKDGGNVTDFLKKTLNESKNTSSIIEVAYDLQSGSYKAYAENNLNSLSMYAEEISSYLKPILNDGDNLLDVGSGELTTLSMVLKEIDNLKLSVYALDISWSRLFVGQKFYNDYADYRKHNLCKICGDISALPFGTASIDVVTSSHALEPNGNNLKKLLEELFRVSKKYCVLFEPSYEMNSLEGRKRMDKLGYIKGIEEEVKILGGKVLDVSLLKNIDNPLNPTACYVIEVPDKELSSIVLKEILSAPGTDFLLERGDGFYSSSDTGLLFPIIKDIPILKFNSSILGSAYFDASL
jgi:ubiquinone/menaquinone biosynthesis C-methylase UbiE